MVSLIVSQLSKVIRVPSRKQLRELNQGSSVQKKHHWGTRLLGICAVIVLLFCSFAQATVLNEQFMVKELTNSGLAREVQNDVNASLASYGIQGDVITTSQTNQLLKQAIHQIYQGKPLQLDTSDVANAVQGRVGNTLAKYGVSSSLTNDVPTSSINSQVSTIINNRINTTDVAKLENGIHVARVGSIIGLVVSIIVLLMIVIRDIFAKALIADFRWITLLSGILSAFSLSLLKPERYAHNYASFAEVINEIGHAILKVGWQMIMVDLGLAIFLFIIAFVFNRRKA